MTLAVRDPDWGYAIWEVTASGVRRAQGLLGRDGFGAPLVLRLYRMSSKNKAARPRFTDFPLEQWIGEQPVVLEPGMTHQVVIGVHSPNQAFSPACRSALVTAPLGRQETLDEAQFVRVACANHRLVLEDCEQPPTADESAPEEWQPPSLFGASEDLL